MRELIFFAIMGAAIAVPRNTQRIVGGEITTVENHPFMANMQYNFGGVVWNQACGGSLISTRAVLSAAHCYSGDLPQSWRVVLGTSLATTGGAEYTVERLVVHMNYSWPTPLVNDVAIVRLASQVVLSESVKLARIAGPHYRLPDGETITIIGWGATSSGGASSLELRRVDINVINHELCRERYAYLKSQPGFQLWPDITDDMLCAGILNVGGMDACQGDSGGPVVHGGDIIVGVVSWGYSCADAFYPGVNAKVSYFSDWIAGHAV